jgi:hypothetical protein
MTDTPNQALERTATRRVFTFKMTETFALRATLALRWRSLSFVSLGL